MIAKENRKTDIVLVLKPIDGSPRHASGLIDRKLFTGENNLHAIMDTQTCLWRVQYEHGTVPEPLRQRFTSYAMLIKFVTDYMKRRNINIVEIRD